MEEPRSAYVMAEGFALAERLKTLYDGTIARDDPLRSLLEPVDQRGEVAAWGGPHITALDALSCADPGSFDRIVAAVVRRTSPPEIKPLDLALVGPGQLVIRCVSPALDELRARLIQVTRPLMTRLPLTDEEIQRACWWVERHGGHVTEHRETLDSALRIYCKAGWPPLPSSRHFRLGFLVKLCLERDRASSADRDEKQARLDYFLSMGEPPWYSRPGGLHLTIASGLELTSTEIGEPFRSQLWESIRRSFESFQPSRLAIMGEDPDHLVSVQFNDALTASYVPETRPGFKVVAWADFAS